MSYKNTVCFTPANIDACGLWRMFMPHLNTPDSRFIFSQKDVPLNHIAECDVVCVQRMMLQGNLEFLKMARQFGIKVIYDLDDNVWNLPASNPAKKAFDDHRAGLESCAEWADVITVSTRALQKAAKREWSHLRNVATKKKIPVVVIENYTDLRLFKPEPIERDPDIVVIGWGGSNTHGGDLWHVWQILPELVAEFPQVRLEFVGMSPPRQIADHPQVKHRGWVHISEFHARVATWDWDIFMAPLEVNPFNRSKSSIKMQEAGAIGRPCLATSIDNYDDFATGSLRWLTCFSPYDWKEKLRTLIRDRSMRIELGLAMRERVETHYNIANEAWRWQEAVDLAVAQ